MNDYVEMLEILELIQESLKLAESEPVLLKKCRSVVDGAIANYITRIAAFEEAERNGSK